MEELELALQYLNRRSVSVEKVKNGYIRQFVRILPVSEVQSVLEMVKKGEFSEFYNKMKELGHKDCI